MMLTTAAMAALIIGGSAQMPEDAFEPEQLIPDRILVGFEEPDAAARWVTVNDNVMGGRSVGGFEVGKGRLRFSGRTNTDGGGFSSIRTRPASWGLADADGLLFRIRGDGRTYIASLTMGSGRGEVKYWAEFSTRGEFWETARLPFGSFEARWRGRDVSDRAPPLDPAEIATIGVYINDGRDGPFGLEIEWIGSYTDRDGGRAAAEDRPGEAAEAGVSARVVSVLGSAIERGVPRFNRGEHGACADIYEVAIRSVLMLGDGLDARALRALRRGLEVGREADGEAARAWAYRNAMDAALDLLAERRDLQA